MTTRFKQLFEIQLKHTFYHDGRCPDFQLIPTAASQQLMQRLGLLVKPSAHGVFVLYKFTEGESALIQTLKTPIALSFVLLSKNPTLLNFTDLPIQKENTQYYFSNDSKQADEDGTIQLNQEDFVSTADVMSFRNAAFPIEVNAEGDKKVDVKVSNETGTLIVDQTVEDQQYFHLNLSQQDPGKYSITVADQAPISFYFEPALNAQHFGLVELKIDTQDQQFFDEQKKCVFDIRFKNRSTTWRYHIVNQQSEQSKTFKIVDKTDTVQFTEGKEVVMPDGNKAMRFDSIAAAVTQEGIDLKERYGGHFQLEMYGEAQQLGGRRSKKTIILPNANVQQVRIEKSDEGLHAFSDLYVYI